MPHAFRLFWLRETGCDAGTLLRADQLEPEIRDHVVALAEGGPEATVLRLPFFDQSQWKRRRDLLAGLRWERQGSEIVCVLGPTAALRDLAAQLALTHPAWTAAPAQDDPCYFRVWQSISIALQTSLRSWTSEAYFRDVARYENRALAYPVLLYETARPSHGKPRMDFTYDLSDYPKCNLTLAMALKLTGLARQASLARVEQRLLDAGDPVLAHRYAPVWHQDIVREVRRKPRRLVKLLADEVTFVNAVIDLGSNRTAESVNRFGKAAGQSLRNVHGMDLRSLGLRALDLTTEILKSAQDGMVEESVYPKPA